VGPIKYLKQFDMVNFLSTAFIKMTPIYRHIQWNHYHHSNTFYQSREIFCWTIIEIFFTCHRNIIEPLSPSSQLSSHHLNYHNSLEYFAVNGFQSMRRIYCCYSHAIVIKCFVLYVLNICYPHSSLQKIFYKVQSAKLPEIYYIKTSI